MNKEMARAYLSTLTDWVNSDGTLWVKGSWGWTKVDEPKFDGEDYFVIGRWYEEAWKAYREGCLQYKHGAGWRDWTDGPPAFNLPPDHYRRKLKCGIRYTTADGVTRVVETNSPVIEVWYE